MIDNILLVNDNDTDNFISKTLLEKSNIAKKITIKTSAKEALDYLDELQKNSKPFPTIILLDLNMPLITGFEFLNFFSLYNKDVIKRCGIFILSSSSDTADIYKAKRLRYVQDYFIKPLTKDKIEKLVNYGASVQI